jgi:hypothetical protein
MSEAHSPLTQNGDLERALTELAPGVAYPPTPDLAATIRTRIAAAPGPSRPGWSWPALFRPRRLAVAFLVLLIIAVGALAISPDLRTAVAKRLGIHGIEIIFVDETPTPPASPVGTTLLLGEPMTLAEAQSRVGYVIKVPAALGPPDEVYLRPLEAGPMVTLLYRPRLDLPEAEETGVGALLMQFPATSDVDQIVKRVTMGTGSMLRVPVNGVTGYWVMGSSELIISQDPSAGFEQAVGRPSADVLIWEQDGMAYRLEVNLLMSDAISIAESLQQPASTPSPP